eukprot:7377920-Prymnesium_polylepis.2
MLNCKCTRASTAGSSSRFQCMDSALATPVDWRAEVEADRRARALGDGSRVALSFCVARQWLLEHMPEFDTHFLPGSVTVNGTSMLDDTIAFAMMTDVAASWSATIPLEIKLPYLLPYAAFHESRQNWRPLLFSKFFAIVANATTVEEAMERLVAPNLFTQWTDHYWPSSPRQPSTSVGVYHSTPRATLPRNHAACPPRARSLSTSTSGRRRPRPPLLPPLMRLPT